jgi:hypothetical protein
VGDTVFAVLPNIKPLHTFIITLLFQFVRPAEKYKLSVAHEAPGLPDQAVAPSDVQVLRDCTHALRVHIIYVWLACAREGDPPCSRPSQVGLLVGPEINPTDSFAYQSYRSRQPHALQDIRHRECGRHIFAVSAAVHASW